MITGFENITAELNEHEINVLVPLFVSAFNKHVGKENIISNNTICTRLKSKGHNLSEARVRKIIHYIRATRQVKGLIATSGGYYVSENADELKKYYESLKQRRNSIDEVLSSIYQDFIETTNGKELAL